MVIVLVRMMMMMVTMEEIACEMSDHEKRNGQGLPPGFRFHPTDQELITFYLASKVFNTTNSSCNHHLNFVEVDLNRCEPWELPEVAKMGEREWYLYSVRDRKYPTGLRTNRATAAGYWKATGKDKQVYGGGGGGGVVGMKKTLVFYKGRAPRGQKTKWVMHEFRLDPHTSSSSLSKDEWVICRIFHKTGEKRTCTTNTPLLLHQQQQDHPLLFQIPSSQSHNHNHNLFTPLLHPSVFPTPPAAEPTKNNRSSSSSIIMNNHNYPPPPPSSQTLLKLNKSTKLTKTQPPPTSSIFQYQQHHQQLPPDDPNLLLHWIDSTSNNNNNNCNQIMDAAAGLIGFFSSSGGGPSPTTTTANNAEIIRDIIMSSSSSQPSMLDDGIQSNWPHHHHHHL